jgi:hypothetical protein
MRQIILFLLLIPVCALAAWAKPAPPIRAPQLANLSFGLYCAIAVTGRAEEPNTASGYIHLADEAADFQWPGQNIVPAVLGLAFGVKAQTRQGIAFPNAEMRVFQPGRAEPDIWGTGFSDQDSSLAFFRFDRPDELVPGIWVFEAWSGRTRLYRVEFEVVPAAEGNAIVQACGGIA